MIENILTNELTRYKKEIEKISDINSIDCITIFPISEKEYFELNNELHKIGTIVDEMKSGNLFFIEQGLNTLYGKLFFIKIRIYDIEFANYRISVDFTVKDYKKFKSSIKKPFVKEYSTFELIQFKNNNSIINVVSLPAKEEYVKNNTYFSD